ncbi:MAG: DMT family transporter [Bacteriovoracaceae bacterium]
MNQKTQSLLLGLLTIFCWGSLATFGKILSHIPPFYVLALTFFIGAVPAFLRPREMFPNLKVVLCGVLGYFGYHFFLFYAFRFAPAIEANLINYMWPVFLVLLTPLFFKNGKLQWYHILGSVLAISGCFLMVFAKGFEIKSDYLFGYLLAFGASLTWPLFTIFKKKLPTTSVWAVGGFCLGSSILSFITHLLLEPRVVLQFHDLIVILVMGLGPFAIAFYCWELALQKGDTKLLGALAYLTPVLSSLGLIFFVGEPLSFTTGVAMVLIIGGASSGLLDFLPSKALK